MILGSGSASPQSVKATLYRNGLELQQTHADQEGRFSFLQLTEGDYEVRIEAEGYQTYLHRAQMRYPGHEEEHFSVRLTPLEADADYLPQDPQKRLELAFQQPDLFRELSPLLQIEVNGRRLSVVMGVPSQQVEFEARQGGYHAEILFAGQVFDRKGRPVSKELPISRGFQLDLTEEQLQSLGEQPLLARSQMEIGKGAYKLILVVQDRLAGKSGTAVREFRVP